MRAKVIGTFVLISTSLAVWSIRCNIPACLCCLECFFQPILQIDLTPIPQSVTINDGFLEGSLITHVH